MEFFQKHFSEDVCSALLRANVSNLSELFKRPKKILWEETNLTPSELDRVLNKAAEIYFCDKIRTIDDLPKDKQLKTGCSSIDLITNGGLALNNGLIEVMGCAGVGKTQFCLQLALMCQLPPEMGGIEKDVVYLCTEDLFPTSRLNELAQHFQKKFNTDLNFQDNILISHISNYEHLQDIICTHLRKVLNYRKIGLLVIDSIAGLFRGDPDDLSLIDRCGIFLKFVANLKQLSRQHDFAVVCVNQVSSNLETGQTVSALGLTWSNLITTRLSIQRPSIDSDLREFHILFAPDLANASCSFRIARQGLVNA